MSDKTGHYQGLDPVAPNRGFESMDSESNSRAREVLREERLEPRDGEDAAREGLVHDLTQRESRPLTDDERDAAKHDPGRSERVYAPASARVAKEPAPGDDRLIHDNQSD